MVSNIDIFLLSNIRIVYAALEGFTEALAKELDPKWNIKVGVINFAGFLAKSPL